MMYNDVDSDLTPFSDQIDGDEIFLFSNTKTSSNGPSFLHEDDDDHLRHHNNVVAGTSSHHMPVDVDDLLLNTNFLEQPNCDTTEDPLFWNCKDISDDNLNDIWPQNQVNLSVSNISTINGISNDTGNIQSNDNNSLAQTLSIGLSNSLTNCNNSSTTLHQPMHNGITINGQQQTPISSQVHQHSQQTLLEIQQQQLLQRQQQQHGLATLISQPSQISQLQQHQHLQVRLHQSQQNDVRSHQQAIRAILPSQPHHTTLIQPQQQQGFQQPQHIIQHIDNFQNNWITVVSSNDQFQTFNQLPPQQIDNQQQVAQFFDKITHTIIQTDNGPVTAQIPVTGMITTAAQQVLLHPPQIPQIQQQQQQQQQQPPQQHQQQPPQQLQQPQQQQQQVSSTQTVQQTQNVPQSQELQPQQQGLQSQQTSRKSPPQQQQRSNQLKVKKDSNKTNQDQNTVKSKSEPEISDTSKKEVAKLNKPKEKQTRLDCPYCKRSFCKNFDLQQHMRCHTGEKPFQCIVCGRGFAQKSNVKKHMQAHKVWPEGPNPAMPSNNGIRSRDNSASSSVGMQRDDECMQENESVHINNELGGGHALGLSNDRKNDGNDIFAENRYSCSYCHFNGKTYFELKSHLTIHKREKVFKCIVSSCGKTFSGSDLQGFLDHVTGHKDLIYHCHLCSGQFHSLDEFGEHQKHHSSAQVRKSSQNQSLTSNANPQQVQNLSKPITASLRQQNQQVVPPTQSQSQQIQRPHNQQQTIMSQQTQPQASQQQGLQQPQLQLHLKLETQSQPQLQVQLQTQSPPQPGIQLQSLQLPSQQPQQQQQQQQQPQQQPPQQQSQNQQQPPNIPKAPKARIKNNQKFFRCSKCMNRYTTQTALDHHLSISTHNFPCTECNKVFMCERYLRRHLNTHTAVQHVCTFCDKHFKTAAYLKMHSVVHTGEKPFRCNQCEAAFNRRDKLSRHKLTHETVKKFKCPFKPNIGCTKEFNRPDKLKAHVLTHSGVRPHPCDLCSRTFSRLSRLREHKKLHHPSLSGNSEKFVV